MAVVQTIPNTRLTGQQTFTFTKTAQSWTTAALVIDRTVSGGLNSLTTADTLGIDFDYSPDGGTTWQPFAGIVCVGGLIVTKGHTLSDEELTLSSGVVPFPSGTGFRIRTNASSAVRITGTITYDNVT